MKKELQQEANEIGALLLDIGTALLSSGASCARILVTINRIATNYNYIAYTSITHKSISLTLHNEDDKIVLFSGLRTIAAQGVNFRTIAAISRLSWKTIDENLVIHEVKEKLQKILTNPHYPRGVILFFVSIAGAAFCFSFGGDAKAMLITFCATFVGLFVRQEAVKYKFNAYICVFLGALSASLFSGAFIETGKDIYAEHAFATSVLFLIPGVPLINCFTDLIDGNILNGIVRGINALIFAFAIALGLLSALLIYNL
ncbi:MAG: threonine/serine ThrE exporter family protein [Anaerovoracaceae bacterium]